MRDLNMSAAPELRAVLFDMDGTLLDSEKVWDVALEDLATWLGGQLSESARHRMIGSSLARSVTILHDDLQIDADPESSGAFLLARTEELFYTDLVWKPGAQDLLTAVRAAELSTALVTSTHRMLTEIALQTLGNHNFDVTVCGDEVGSPKPHPQPYADAARKLEVPITSCLVIEDSLLGITSAEAAGAVVIAVPSELPVPPKPSRVVMDSLAGVTVADLEDVFDRIAGSRRPS